MSTLHAALHPFLTTWHITFGTHGARLHGGSRATVDRQHNQRGQPFVGIDLERERRERELMAHRPVALTLEECLFIESVMASICERGGWVLRACAAPPPESGGGDHVHVLLDAPPEAPPKVIRELLKRWLTQALNNQFSSPCESFRARTRFQWWAEGGSTKPVKDVAYLNNAHNYVERQRASAHHQCKQ